jgi:hypothetical protein
MAYGSAADPCGARVIHRLMSTPAQSFDEVRISVDAIRFLSAEVAIAETTARFSTGTGPPPRGTLVLVREDDTWLIAAARVLPGEQ